jgi:glycosyltransferase involved in cell wall biosynthesis
LNTYPDAVLRIIADRKWISPKIPPDRIDFIPWSRQIEIEALHEMTIGIMPLEDNEWTRGKCSFKMLQYMAVGLPVIVSPAGMNKEVLEKGLVGIAASTGSQWYQALEHLYKNRGECGTMGLNGRKVVEQFYSTQVTGSQIAQILKTVSGK